jgi:hypothetical protein
MVAADLGVAVRRGDETRPWVKAQKYTPSASMP